MNIKLIVQNSCSKYAWIFVFIFTAGAIQLSIPYPLDADSAYHAVVGQLIREHGILYSFPWTPYSWFADHYADKELLFHLLFVPFIGLGDMLWTDVAKIVGTLSGALVLSAIYFTLRAEKIQIPWLWSFITLAVSCDFYYRFALVRPHLLSIVLTFVIVWSVSRGRFLMLATASVIYPWAYVAWHLPVILVCIVETARYLSSERIRFKPLLIALSGVSFGVMLHPNAFNLVRLTWIQIVGVLLEVSWGKKAGFDLGAEFMFTSLYTWTHGLAICLIMAVAAIYFSWSDRKTDSTALAFALTALAFGLLTFRTHRFLEYFVPYSVAAFAMAMRTRMHRLLPYTILCISLIYTLSLNYESLRDMNRRPDDMPPASLHFLRQAIPAGSQVFTPDWILTGTLMLALPDRYFMVALDPTFFYKKDPELYKLWYTIPREPGPDAAQLIRKHFKSRYVLCYNKEQWRPFMNCLSKISGVQSYVVDGIWVLFDLGEEHVQGKSQYAPR